jgi:hypothetical protein
MPSAVRGALTIVVSGIPVSIIQAGKGNAGGTVIRIIRAGKGRKG